MVKLKQMILQKITFQVSKWN